MMKKIETSRKHVNISETVTDRRLMNMTDIVGMKITLSMEPSPTSETTPWERYRAAFRQFPVIFFLDYEKQPHISPGG